MYKPRRGLCPADTLLNTPSGIAGIGSLFTQQNTQSNSTPNKPKAFINVIFFNEQFKAVDFKTSMVGSNSELKDHFADLQNIVAPASGFVYIYCSNESPVNVFFDNLQVVQTRSPILEETHYYPFGLTMAGISSKAAGTLQNKEKTFQGQKFDDDLGLNWVQFKWRNHDPQIGRFIELDPLAIDYVYNSPYSFSENHVTSHIELEGLEKVSIQDIKSPYVRAFLQPSVTQAGQKMANNIDNAGSLKVGVAGGGVGFRGSLGPFNLKLGASGPQASMTITPGGTITSEGSVATAGAEVSAGSVKAGGSITFGSVRFGDGKLQSEIVTSGQDASASRESGGFKKEASSSGQLSIGATLGILSADANLAPVKVAAAVVSFFEFVGSYIKEVVKGEIPIHLGGTKEVRNP